MQEIRGNVSDLSASCLTFTEKVCVELSQDGKNPYSKALQNAIEEYNKRELTILFSGEIKTGKSSTINSILGEDYCMVDAGVCTNVCTMIRWGGVEVITVYFIKEDESESLPIRITRNDLPKYVGEKENKNNQLNVRLIVIETPSDLLKDGIVIIDTPGLGSLNSYHTATTFSMAPIADVLVLVSSANREITAVEIEYFSQLIEASNCLSVIHVVTGADHGDPDIILEANMQHLHSIKKWNEDELKCCKVSNVNYGKYSKGQIDDIRLSGFDQLFSIMNSIKDVADKFSSLRMLSYLDDLLSDLSNDLTILNDSIGNIGEAEDKKSKIQAALDRVVEIQSASAKWRIKLNSAIKLFSVDSSKEVKTQFDDIRTVVKDKLKKDEYLKHPNKLGSFVTAQATTNMTKLERIIKDNLVKVYSDVRKESGLDLIREELTSIGNVMEQVSLSDVQVDSFKIRYSEYMTRTVGYTAIGAIIGAIIGTYLFPGFGTWIGAKLGTTLATILSGLGSIVGVIHAFFVGAEKVKEAKRAKIFAKLDEEITKSQNETATKVSSLIINSEEKLRIAFEEELKNEQDRCKNLIATLNKVIAGDMKRLETVKSLKKECDHIKKRVFEIQAEVSNLRI